MSSQRPNTSNNAVPYSQGTSSSAAGSSRKSSTKQLLASASRWLQMSQRHQIYLLLSAASRTTKSIIDAMRLAIDDNQEDWIDLTQRMEQYKSAIKDQIDSFPKYPPEESLPDEVLSCLLRYQNVLEDFSTVVNQAYKRRRMSISALTGIGKVKVDAGAISKFNRDIEDAHRQFMEAMIMFIASRVQVNKAILANVDKSAILQLPLVPFVASSVHNPCLQGTRRAVLETISRWAEDDMSGKPIFWVCDIAGSGKSTVAMSAMEMWRADGTLGGQFFFSMSNSEASTTEKFCSTMARELVHHIPELAPHITEAVTQNPAIMRSPLSEQFRTLITRPLRHRRRRVVLVIDAIDECKSGTQRKDLLETLATATRESRNLKIFITSRPDSAIEAVLRPLSIKEKLEDHA
ncbi:SubName: Full=Related to archipelago beta form (F-box-WD40 repeat protein) {ECO:0000313/EMBL:CCA76847.1} [Serendipita indica DSM 11827]|nr:SubName: Full=Related to archipelago beta form (F-box-WD40 repeat protein) {ECO:0000313/EMBL:CCA76847.1} [Serendipita indica DSM 11827]